MSNIGLLNKNKNKTKTDHLYFVHVNRRCIHRPNILLESYNVWDEICAIVNPRLF